MAKIEILVKGYAKEINGEEFASSSVVLVHDNGLNIVVDPGMGRKALLDGLSKERLTPDKIDFIILTHTHLDHCLLTGIFENAKILDNGDIFSFDGHISQHEGKVPGTNIEIIGTPGHDQFHCSVLINTEEFGKVVVAGDIFWWVDDEEQKTDKESLSSHNDPYVKDEKALKESRNKILDIADYIIPGHGKMFKVDKK